MSARSSLWWTPVLLVSLIGGCQAILQFDEKKLESTGGGGTTTTTEGGGGTTTTTQGGGGTTTQGGGGTTTTQGGGGSTTTDMCQDPANDCPPPSGECRFWECPDGACIEVDVPDFTPVANQVAGDCKQNVCLGGQVATVDDNGDIGDDGQDCTAEACVGGVPIHNPLGINSNCAQAGGKVCDDQGNCVECNTNAQCPLNNVCEAGLHICISISCMDGMKNGVETDTDCGGPDCGGCANGLICNQNQDCLDGYCAPNGKCQPCGSDANCDPNKFCSVGVCQFDKPTGAGCSSSGQCQTNACVDGVCCAAAVCGTCQTCNAAVPGACTNVPSGAGDETCQAAAGKACDGNGNCKQIDGLSCASPSDCLSGNCVDGVCCNQICNGPCKACNIPGSPGMCANVPLNQPDPGTCSGSNVCNGLGQCLKSIGQTCVSSAECAGGFCVDNVCCNQSACPACLSCSAGMPGVCSNLPFGAQDNSPPATCNGSNACDGGGQCKKNQGSPCVSPGECLTGQCVDGFCCSGPCMGLCIACSNMKTGGMNGVCLNIPAGADPDMECTGPMSCNGAGNCQP